MTPKEARGAEYHPIEPGVAEAALRGPIGRLRTQWQEWPWPARLDYLLGTRPLFELVVQAPRGDVRGWFACLRQVVHTTFFTARGRAFVRWHWDYVHNGSQRPELRRKLDALDRLERIRSRYWEQPWFLDDDEDADQS